MTEPYYRDESVTVYAGDCLDVLAELPDASVDAVTTDPPYGLEFMGKDWDRPWAVSPTGAVGFSGRENNLTLPSFGDNRNANCRACGGRQRGKKRCLCESPQWDRDPASDMRAFGDWCHAWATECLRVLKPGGHLLAFGGTRTWHRLACAVEDAGFEIRDSIAWMYGSGFPKSLDVSKAIDNAAGARREVVGHRSANASIYNGPPDSTGSHIWSGSLTSPEPITPAAKQWQGWGTALKPAFEPIVVARKPLSGTVAANVQAYGTGALNVDGCRVDGEPWKAHRATGLAATKFFTDGEAPVIDKEPHAAGRWPANVLLDQHTAEKLDRQSGNSISRIGKPRGATAGDGWGMTATGAEYDDEGGASRFFPTFRYHPKANSDERPTANGIAHPTVKPVELMRWLIRLVTPAGGVVLDPFGGSGTTAEAAIKEHKHAILIEREPDYLPLITQRLTTPMAVGFNFEEGD